MSRRDRHPDSYEELNIWPAFTDLMSNAFMILSLFLLLALVRTVFLKSDVQKTEGNLAQIQKELNDKKEKLIKLENELGQSQNIVSNLQGQIEKLKSPPLIVIKDSQERRFESGSAELSPQLRGFVENDLANQIESYAREYQGYVVEIIGHTDGQINNQISSNLDEKLEDVASGSSSITDLKPGSNADLGLMRALAVVQTLQNLQRSQNRLQGLKFRAYSAAQLFLPGGEYATINRTSDQTRRRIEIRFTPPAVER